MKRQIIKTAFFIISLVIIYLVVKEYIEYDIHQFCPYSVVCFGVPTRFSIFTMTLYPVMVLGLLIPLSTIWLGRWFCTYVCFLGTTQSWLYQLRMKAYKKKILLPAFMYIYMPYLKFVVLAGTIGLSIYGISFYMDFCPLNVIASITTIGWYFVGFMGMILLCSLFVPRCFCVYLCPFGALQILFMKIKGLGFRDKG